MRLISSTLNEKNKHRVRVRRSYAGLGLFAADTFKKGEKIVEYVGYKMTNKKADERGGNKYLLEVNARYAIDGSPRFNIARYANHSCKPNTDAYEERGRIFLVAKRNISPGEEIVWNYGKTYFDEYIGAGNCLCAACM